MMRVDTLSLDDNIPDKRPQGPQRDHLAQEFLEDGQGEAVDELVRNLRPWAANKALGYK